MQDTIAVCFQKIAPYGATYKVIRQKSAAVIVAKRLP